MLLSETRTLLSRYAGQGNDFEDRLNLVRARLFPMLNSRDTKLQRAYTVYSDRDGNSIITPERDVTAILAGAVRSPNVLCTGDPMGVRGGYAEFSTNGLGYGGLTMDFTEVNGRFCVFQEWSDSMLLRFKFEATESSGVIHIRGALDGEKVYSLYSGSWIDGEKVAFVGTTTVTTTKYFDPDDLSVVKPVTNGRVTMYAVDSDGIETAVASYEPSETVPRWKRYKVPDCEDVSAIESTTPVTPSQFYTKQELDDLFKDEGTITVSTTSSHDLVYAAYFLRIVKVVGAAGSGSYTHDFLLDNSTAKNGATLRVVLSVAASANPHLKFWDNVATGSPLCEVDGDSSNVQNFTLVFSYNASAWTFEGREL